MAPRWTRIPIRDRVHYERPEPTFVDVARAGTQPVAHAPSTRMDRVAIALSLLCGVHCFLTPILLLALPALGRAFGDERVHWMMAVFVVPLAAWAIGRGYRLHRRTVVPMLGGIGAALVITGLFVHSAAHASTPAAPAADAGAHVEASTSCCPSSTDHTIVQTNPLLSHDASALTTLAGSLMLVGAHGWNARLCHCKECVKHDRH